MLAFPRVSRSALARLSLRARRHVLIVQLREEQLCEIFDLITTNLERSDVLRALTMQAPPASKFAIANVDTCPKSRSCGSPSWQAHRLASRQYRSFYAHLHAMPMNGKRPGDM